METNCVCHPSIWFYSANWLLWQLCYTGIHYYSNGCKGARTISNLFILLILMCELYYSSYLTTTRVLCMHTNTQNDVGSPCNNFSQCVEFNLLSIFLTVMLQLHTFYARTYANMDVCGPPQWLSVGANFARFVNFTYYSLPLYFWQVLSVFFPVRKNIDIFLNMGILVVSLWTG